MKSSMKSSFPAKVVIALFVLFFVSKASYAQLSRFHWGITAGANMFKVTGRSFDEKSKPGFSAGFYGEYRLAVKWYIQPELLWNQVKGTTTSDFNQIYPGSLSSDFYLNYVTLPVMIAFKPVPELSLLLGGQYGYLVNQTTGLSPTIQEKVFSKSDAGIIFGGQLNLKKVKVGLRYVINVTDMNGINGTDLWRYHGFQAHIGYQIK